MDAIQRYANYQDEIGFDKGAFLHAAVFRMLHRYCSQGDQRLINFMKDIIVGTNNNSVPIAG
jgi:hypothetical protein